jgi:hypothetical protein
MRRCPMCWLSVPPSAVRWYEWPLANRSCTLPDVAAVGRWIEDPGPAAPEGRSR